MLLSDADEIEPIFILLSGRLQLPLHGLLRNQILYGPILWDTKIGLQLNRLPVNYTVLLCAKL